MTTNNGYLSTDISKRLQNFKIKTAQEARETQFFFQNNEIFEIFKMFKNMFKVKFDTKANSNKIQWWCLLYLFQTKNSYPFGKFYPKNCNFQFKLKIGTQANFNMKNSTVMFMFLCFRPEVYFFLEICSKNQSCLLKLKCRIQINLNMQNSVVIFISFSSEIPFLC